MHGSVAERRRRADTRVQITPNFCVTTTGFRRCVSDPGQLERPSISYGVASGLKMEESADQQYAKWTIFRL